jgi:hypothetical protein
MPLPSVEMSTLLDELADRERHYAAIGKVTSNWAAFEQLVHSSLWCLAKAEDRPGACLTAQIPNIARAFDALASLADLHGGSKALVRKINQFAEHTHAINGRRNRIVHDPWNWNDETGKPYRLQISAQKKLVFGPLPMDTKEVDQLVEDIFNHINAYETLVTQMSVQLASAGILFRPPIVSETAGGPQTKGPA